MNKDHVTREPHINLDDSSWNEYHGVSCFILQFGVVLKLQVYQERIKFEAS